VTARTAKSATPTRATVKRAPVQLKSRPKTDKREPLFSIDDVVYTMPAVVRTGDAILLAGLLRMQADEDAKGLTLVRNLCGSEAAAALLSDSTMSRGEWQAIVAILTERVFGNPETEEEGEGN
jgi:hypothetical protein